ncbi:hypothetical protein [Halomonas alkalicola]|uniref:Oxidoreductase-like domain-containing protein n=1 Tax=Halomonas alkalicola TaxID=1930622 RepID=A0ABY9H898_9GAMM|nr:hypothetical protein [Halomonas alkalicola]WLI74500.1 hypothetical protein B6N23_06255 [Halomonas alkalicola]
MSRRTRPDLNTAMRGLIHEIRAQVPFDTPESSLCRGPCRGCSKKLLEFLDTELEEWEGRLEEGEVPRFGDLARLGRLARKVVAALRRNGLIASA